MSTDPFLSLAQIDEPLAPRPEFAASLRSRLVRELGIPDVPTVSLPPRSTSMTNPTATVTNAIVVPYLTVHDGAAALGWYAMAFDAIEQQRVTGDDGKIGHAEFTLGGTLFYLSDEYPDYEVRSPRSLGGSAVALHLTVADVDAVFSRAIAAGATVVSEPADQPHGARHGTLHDPYGHRWMLSQQIESIDAATYAERMADSGFSVTSSPAAPNPATDNGHIWGAVNATNAPAMIRFLVDTLGFTEQLIVSGENPDIIEHSQLHWPDGGVIQVGSANRPGNPYSAKPIGALSTYLITKDPTPIYQRCLAAGVGIVQPPMAPDYDPDGLVFTIADHEGNLWSVGTYAGES